MQLSEYAGIRNPTSRFEDMLSNNQCPYFVPYYAFLPETDGIMNEAEFGLTFFSGYRRKLINFSLADTARNLGPLLRA